MANYNDVKTNVLELMVNIKVVDGYFSYDKVCTKMFHLWEMLKETEVMGWQINFGQGKQYIFYNEKINADEKDIGWIFEDVYSFSNIGYDVISDIYGDERRVYRISIKSDKEKAGIKNIRKGRSEKYEYYEEMLKYIEACKGSIRVTFKGNKLDSHGSGYIYISMNKSMSLRFKVLLSVIFPGAAVTEVSSANVPKMDDLKDIEATGIPAGIVVDFIQMVMHLGNNLINDKSTGKNGNRRDKDMDNLDVSEDDYYSDDSVQNLGYGETLDMEEDLGGLVEDDEALDCDGSSDNKEYLIDELELSVRAYNCLKRAGINTIDQLLALSDEDLRTVRNLGRKSYEEVKERIAEWGYELRTEKGELENPVSAMKKSSSAELEGLIGLTSVKDQVKKIKALAKMKKAMAEGQQLPINLNMEFVGNPGTAKTTVARLLAGILYEAGVLKSSKLIEVGRADLVGKYVGHTADKVKTVFAKAKGKLLFIDEAYSLLDDNEGSFGDEAINTIVQEMENHRNDTIVIFAGYPEEMESFFQRNPGLRSRVPFIIEFKDYSADELIQIAENEALKRGFSFSEDVNDKIRDILDIAMETSDMGNGRFCRNLVENAILAYALRIYGDDSTEIESDFILRAEDFSLPENIKPQKPVTPMGFVVYQNQSKIS